MANSRIKGITIELDGDTVGLQKALKEVDSKSRNLATELKDVERLLKFDPGNTELLAQKQKLLQEAVLNTAKRLDQLRAAQSQVNEQFERGELSDEQYRAFQREITKTEQELKKMDSQLDTNTQSLKEQGVQVSKLGKDYQESFDQAKQSMGNAFDQMKKAGAAITAAGVGMAVGLGKAVSTSMEFEAQLSRVGAIADATDSQLVELRDSALELGASSSKSASEVAKGQEELAALGFTVNDILSAMPGVISAAEASGADMAQTAEVMASTLNIFGKEASEATKVADILAKTANVSAADITDMQYALKYAGPPAAALGVSLEELSASIGIMTNAGMKGEQAGTTLRAALLSLLDPSEENSKLMNTMGVEITDLEGNFVGLEQLVRNLSDSMDGMTDTQKAATLSSLVGTEAVSGMLSLMSAGPEKINEFTKSLEDSGGASAEAATKMKDNLKGAIEEMSGAFETLAISIGTALTPVIRAVAEALGNLANWFNNLSPTMQNFIIAATAISAALALITGPLLMLIGFIPQLIAGFTVLAPLIGTAFAAITGPIGIAVAAITAAAVLIYANWEPISEFFIKLWDTISQATSAAWSSITSTLTTVWNSITSTVTSIFTNISQFISTTWKNITSFLTNTWESIKNLAKTSFDAVYNVIKPIMEGLKTYFTGVWQLIKNIFAGALLLIIDLVTGDFESLSKDAQAIWNNLKSAFSMIWEGIKQVFSGTLSAIKTVLTEAWEGMKSVTTTILTSISEWIKTTWDNLLTWFRELPSKLYTIGTDMFLRMKEAVQTTLVFVKDAIVTGMTEAIDWLKQLPSQMLSIGADIINGIIDGIKSKISAVGDAIKDIASTITSGIRNALDIHSPSRVMKELGEFTGEGFVNGITGTLNAVRSAANEMANFATPEVSISATRNAATGSGGITQNITINSPQALSPSDIARKSKQASRQLALEWGM